MEHRLHLLALHSCLVTGAFAQGYAQLGINAINARFHADGMIGMDLASGTPAFEVPAGSGTHPLFVANLWVAGRDAANQLHVAAVRYNQTGEDFWPGPLTNDGTASITPAVSAQWDQVWQVDAADVALHQAYFACLSDPNCDPAVQFPGYQVPASFLNWPAIGDVAQGQDLYLAPFTDHNGDGAYDPADGDAPCAPGDHSLHLIFNDKLDVHTESGGLPIGLEVQARPFAFSGNDPALDHTIFVEYRLINRGTLSLQDVHVGLFTDLDLGNPTDDHIGCDVARDLWYVYNADSLDEDALGLTGYGAQPPAFGATILCGMYQDADGTDNPYVADAVQALAQLGSAYAGWGHGYGDGIIDNERLGLTHFGAYAALGYPGTEEPSLPPGYMGYMSGLWNDGSSWVYGGVGHPSDTTADPNTTTRYLYPGASDPLGFGTNGNAQAPWSEVTAGNVGFDRRAVGSMGPVTLLPGDVHRVMVAFTYARAATGGPLASVQALQARVDSIRAFADAEDYCGGRREDVPCYAGAATGIAQLPAGRSLQLHPVPAADILQVTGAAGSTYAVHDMSGRQVLPGATFLQERTAIDISGLPEGVYLLRCTGQSGSGAKRFVVAR
jgi:hypothetical protein